MAWHPRTWWPDSRTAFFQVFSDARQYASTQRRPLGWSLLAALVLGLILHQFDEPLLAWFMKHRWWPAEWKYGHMLSNWGDYYPGTVIVSGFFLVSGLILRSRRMARTGLSIIIAVGLAGLTTVTLRATFGRPRPFTHLPDTFTGPTTHYDFQGFPSGHSTTAVATAVMVLQAYPVVGVPVAAGALGVAWSRLFLERHHPSDVWAGGVIGALYGVIFAGGLRRRFPKKASPDSKVDPSSPTPPAPAPVS